MRVANSSARPLVALAALIGVGAGAMQWLNKATIAASAGAPAAANPVTVSLAQIQEPASTMRMLDNVPATLDRSELPG